MGTFILPMFYDPCIDFRTRGAILFITNKKEDFKKKILPFKINEYKDIYAYVEMSKDWDPLEKGYVLGDYDGKTHFDEVQQDSSGKLKCFNGSLFHCGGRAYYLVYTKKWIHYWKKLIKKAIDAGVTAIMFSEPEIFRSCGYSPAFKKEWKAYYGSSWQDPSKNRTVAMKSDQLMSYLVYRCIKELSEYVKRISKVKCYLATHDLLNYTQSGIISPIAELAKIPDIAGVMAQVWTDTARVPIMNAGKIKTNIFANAFLQSSYFFNLIRSLGKKLNFMIDGKSDWGEGDWKTYGKLFEDTTVANFMFPAHDYTFIFPERILRWDSPPAGLASHDYKTEYVNVVYTTQNLKDYKGDYKADFGILTSDSIGWGKKHLTDQDSGLIDDFYGLALPLLNKGNFIDVIPAESFSAQKFSATKLILASLEIFQFWKKEYQDRVVDWVKKGGTIIIFGNSGTGYVRDAWWNKTGHRDALSSFIAALGFSNGALLSQIPDNTITKSRDAVTLPYCNSLYALEDPLANVIYKSKKKNRPVIIEKKCGKGNVIYAGISPKILTLSKIGDSLVRKLVKYAAPDIYSERGYFIVNRGPYLIVKSLNKSVDLKGNYVDMFDPKLPIFKNPKIKIGRYAFLYKMKGYPKRTSIIYSSSKISDFEHKAKKTTFVAYGPENSKGVTSIYSPESIPKDVDIYEVSMHSMHYKLDSWKWSPKERILRIRYYHGKVRINIEWTNPSQNKRQKL